MKNANKILFIIILLFVFSCEIKNNIESQDLNKYSIIEEKIKIKELKKIENISYGDNFETQIEIVQLNNGKLFVVCDGGLYIYNFDTKQLLTKVELPKKQGLSNFYYLNEDSIFLLYNPLSEFGFHDSILQLIDTKGELKKIYSFKGAPVFASYNEVAEDTTLVIYNMLSHSLNYCNDKIFLSLARNEKYLGDEDYKNKPIFGYMDLQRDTFVTLDFDYPDIVYGKTFYPHTMSFYSITVVDKKVYVSFQYTPKTFVYDVKDNNLDTIILKSCIIDSVLSVSKTEDLPVDYTTFSFYGLSYNKKENIYERELLMPFDRFGIGSSIIEQFDISYNFVSLAFVPKKNVYLASDNDAFYTYDIAKYLDGRLDVGKYQIKIKEKSNFSIISDLSKQEGTKSDIVEYFKTKGNIYAENFSVTIIWYDMMCQNISDFVLKHYLVNEEKYALYNTYLLIITENPENLKENLFSNYKFKNKQIVHFENFNNFVKYSNYDYMPRVVKVRKNKVVEDVSFEVDEITGEWQNYLVKLTNQQKQM